MNEMPIPPAAYKDPEAVEMLRVWIAGESLWCSVKVGMYKDVADVREIGDVTEETAWGTILADAARHLANALASEYGTDAAQSIDLIRDTFLAELTDPTSEAKGGFL